MNYYHIIYWYSQILCSLSPYENEIDKNLMDYIPGKQWHINWLTPSSQRPPCLHGLDLHSSTSLRHLAS